MFVARKSSDTLFKKNIYIDRFMYRNRSNSSNSNALIVHFILNNITKCINLFKKTVCHYML